VKLCVTVLCHVHVIIRKSVVNAGIIQILQLKVNIYTHKHNNYIHFKGHTECEKYMSVENKLWYQDWMWVLKEKQQQTADVLYWAQ
jgi:hypothetical protein